MATTFQEYIGDIPAGSVTAAQGMAWRSQTFTVAIAHSITGVRLQLSRTGSPGIVTVSIKAVDGSSKPTGADLTSATFDGDGLSSTLFTGELKEIPFLVPAELAASTEFAIVIRAPAGNVSNRVNWLLELAGDPYTRGQRFNSANSGSTWTTDSGDLYFQEFGVAAGTITYTVEVDWNNDGDFDDAFEDITSDVRTMAWGRGADSELEAAQAGTLELVVNNATGKYSPENTSSDLSPNVLPGRPVRVRAIFQSTTYDLFKGKIEKFVPRPTHGVKNATILCVDDTDQLNRRVIEAPSGGAFIDVKLGDDPGPVETILDIANWPLADRTLDAGIDTLDVWWAHKESALAALRKLAKAEGSFMYVDGAGNFVYEDRHHRLGDNSGGAADHLTSQATFSNTMTGMDYEFSARTIRNLINVRGQKLTARSQAYIWETQDTPKVPSNGSLEIWAELPSPVTGIVVPVANTDWKANRNAAGTSTDETANVSIIGVKYGQALQMTLTSTVDVPVFIIPGISDPEHTLRIQAKEFEDNPVFTSAEDSISKTAFGERSQDIDIPFKGNFNDIQSYADYLLARRKDPQPDFTRMSLINSSDALTTQILARQLSDRITVTEDDLGISSQDYFINKMRHSVDMGGLRHTVTFSLARIDEEVFWVLGVDGSSELGQTTVLVF